MQRWFFADELEACDAMAAPPTSSSSVTTVPPPRIEERQWQFRALINSCDLYGNERLAVTGNYETLGNWQLSNVVVMTKDEDSNVWSTPASITIPYDRPTEYRYLVCAVDPSTEKIIVRRWETYLEPRIIEAWAEKPPDGVHDVFGTVDGSDKIDRGWLTSETIVQLKFFNCPFTWKQRMKRRLMHVKVTPMNLKIPSACENNPHMGTTSGTGTPVSTLEDSLSNDTHDTRENGTDTSTAFAFNEVTTLRCDDSVIHQQPQFGTPCGPNDLVIFHLTIGDFESTAYLIDFYTYSSKHVCDEEPPLHFGYHYVLPNLFKRSEGVLEVPVTCAQRHRPLGMMKFGYLIINPVPSLQLDMHVSFSRYWNDKWTGLDVGHRGLGPSFKAPDTTIRENTIISLREAAEHGADMVEFDVQLSKDLVPVVYHDFMIYVSLKSKSNAVLDNDFLALPMRELTVEQLRNLKVYHTSEGRIREPRCFERDDMLEHQPFPPLADVLDAIDPHVGFNIEIKWSQKLQDGTMEEEFEHVVDRNLYLDCILDVVLRHAGERRIVFSCFDPDICTMLRFKQNRFPVMFLTIGDTTKYKKFMDPRGNKLETAVFNSVAMELLGIVAHTEDILRDPSQVQLAKSRGLVMFCWGDDNNSKDTIKLLKDLGLHAIIYDKMDVLTSKEVKQSVFLLQAKESQKELLKLQALEMGKVWHGSPSAGRA